MLHNGPYVGHVLTMCGPYLYKPNMCRVRAILCGPHMAHTSPWLTPRPSKIIKNWIFEVFGRFGRRELFHRVGGRVEGRDPVYMVELCPLGMVWESISKDFWFRSKNIPLKKPSWSLEVNVLEGFRTHSITWSIYVTCFHAKFQPLRWLASRFTVFRNSVPEHVSPSFPIRRSWSFESQCPSGQSNLAPNPPRKINMKDRVEVFNTPMLKIVVARRLKTIFYTFGNSFWLQPLWEGEGGTEWGNHQNQNGSYFDVHHTIL